MSVWLYPNLNYLLEIKTECGQRGLSFMIRLAITWFWGLSHTYIISYRNVIIIIPVHVKQNYITPGGHIFLYICMFPVEIHIVCIDFGCRDGVEWGFAKICLFCVKYVIMWDNWWWSSFSPLWGKYGYEVYGNTGCFAPEVMLGLGWMWMQWLFGCLTLCSKVEYSFIPWKINFVL